MLNRGGLANPDVLLLTSEGGRRCVVKDYAERAWPVRALLAPWLVRRELGLLERLGGVPGVPRPLGRVDRLAFAMQYVPGVPLQRRSYTGRLDEDFFDRLQVILDELAARGLFHTDLRSPTNVIATPEGRPALVDLGSVVRVRLPRALRVRLERRAVAKLRRRFAAGGPRGGPRPAQALKAGGTRFAFRDAGAPEDAVPLLCLHDLGLTSCVFSPLLARAPAAGRRAIAVDLPGFGDSRRGVRSLRPSQLAPRLLACIDAMRIGRVDVLGQGWGAEIGSRLRARAPERVRGVTCLRTFLDSAPAAGEFEASVRRALPDWLSADQLEEIERALRLTPPRVWRLAAAARVPAGPADRDGAVLGEAAGIDALLRGS